MDMTMTGYIPTCDSELGSRYRSKNSHFPFVVSIVENNVWTFELADWLLLHIGKNHEEWEWWWCRGTSSWKFEFKNEEDKVRFILRWL